MGMCALPKPSYTHIHTDKRHKMLHRICAGKSKTRLTILLLLREIVVIEGGSSSTTVDGTFHVN